jgi:putative ABC transport system permease protein
MVNSPVLVNFVHRLSVDFAVAFRNVIRQRRRSAIAVGAVTFGVTALILATGFIDRIFLDFREDTIKSQLGHIQISRPRYHDSGKADPYAFLLPTAVPTYEGSDVGRRITAIAPRLSFSGLISRGDATLSFIGDGVSPTDEAAFDALAISTGKDLSEKEPLAITLGEGLARNLGVVVGDRVVLLSNTVSGGVNALEVTVRGLFSTASKAYDDSALRMHIKTARGLLRTNGSHLWVVLLKDTSYTDAALEMLRRRLPPESFELVPWYRLSDLYTKTKALFTKQIGALQSIIALLIFLGISNTMLTGVLQRLTEIGTSLALGLRRSGIIRLLLSEGLLLGGLGGLTGVLLGSGLAELISAIGVPMPAPPGKTHGYIGGVLFTWRAACEALLLALATAVIASVYPAWKASRLEIVDTLRFNR